jgi:hypothetical protein
MAGQRREQNSVVVAGSAFALGMVAGFVLKDTAKQLFDRVCFSSWHRDYERTATYDENLPDTLGRREPDPEPGQPRFGGTGALGVHPAQVTTRE